MSTEKRPLGPLHVASIVVGAIIGVGIFFTPASLASSLPSPAWVLGIWLLGGVVSASGALVFAELGSRYPHAGGIYVFLRQGFGDRAGPPIAFLYGWIQLLVVQPGSMAVIAIVLVDHIGALVGEIAEPWHTLIAIFAILAFTGANLLGLRTGGRIQVAMAAMKIGALALLVVIGLVWGHAGHLVAPRAIRPEGSALSWLIVGLVPVLFSFGGAYHGTYVAGSVRDPERSVPRGIIGGILVVLVAYLGVNVAFLGLLGHDGLAASKSPAAEVTALALGPFAGKVVAAVIIASAAGILNTICLGFPFVIYAMARDGLFFQRAGKLNPRTRRPSVAVALQGFFACIAVIVGGSRVGPLLTGIAFADAAFQAAVAVVHLNLAFRFFGPRTLAGNEGAARGGIRVPVVAPIVFFVLEVAVAIGCLIGTPKESAYGASALAIGIIAWFAWRGFGRHNKADPPADD
jgi:basic amino acid/polyamine antiporter, APA family